MFYIDNDDEAAWYIKDGNLITAFYDMSLICPHTNFLLISRLEYCVNIEILKLTLNFVRHWSLMTNIATFVKVIEGYMISLLIYVASVTAHEIQH